MVWDYLCSSPTLPSQVDVVIALGSHDVGVAQHAAALILGGLAPVLVVSGGIGKDTSAGWGTSEAEHYAKIARDCGVPDSALILEPHATNTGENIRYSREVLETRGVSVRTVALVTKPYMKRRAYATALRQWPEVEAYASAQTEDFYAYHNRDDIDYRHSMNLMVGDLQRMKLYSELGFQAPQAVPGPVWAAYEELVTAGFDRFVIK